MTCKILQFWIEALGFWKRIRFLGENKSGTKGHRRINVMGVSWGHSFEFLLIEQFIFCLHILLGFCLWAVENWQTLFDSVGDKSTKPKFLKFSSRAWVLDPWILSWERYKKCSGAAGLKRSNKDCKTWTGTAAAFVWTRHCFSAKKERRCVQKTQIPSDTERRVFGGRNLVSWETLHRWFFSAAPVCSVVMSEQCWTVEWRFFLQSVDASDPIIFWPCRITGKDSVRGHSQSSCFK